MVHARCRLHALRRRALGRGRARGPHGNAACIGTRRSFPQAKVRVGLRESAGAAGVWRGPCRWRCTHVNPLPVGTRGDAGRLPGRRAVWASILNGVSGGVLVCRNAPPKIVCVTPSDSPTSGEVRSTAHRPSSGVRIAPMPPKEIVQSSLRGTDGRPPLPALSGVRRAVTIRRRGSSRRLWNFAGVGAEETVSRILQHWPGDALAKAMAWVQQLPEGALRRRAETELRTAFSRPR